MAVFFQILLIHLTQVTLQSESCSLLSLLYTAADTRKANHKNEQCHWLLHLERRTSDAPNCVIDG